MVAGPCRPAALLGQASRGDAAEDRDPVTGPQEPNIGDLVIVLLASTLAGLRDRLHGDGFENQAELVGDLVEITDDYLTRVAA